VLEPREGSEAVAATQPDLRPDDDVRTGQPLGPSSRQTPLPSSTDRWSGYDLDHYHVIKPLGRGGMGMVYLADDTSLDRKVAIKILPDHLYGHKELEERFLREARAQAKLNSPNVVAIHHIGRLPARGATRGGLYFAMELVDGEPLEAILERRSILHPEEARIAMIHVARGLRDAHRAGIIHRDIKPSNLLRNKDGWVKIADFGIAKVNPTAKDDRQSLTQDGVVLGTPLYMAPEQAAGERIDYRADMYSLACTFYHLLAGVPPFDGTNGLHVAAQHISRPHQPIEEVVRDVPPQLAHVFARLMKKKRDDRYQAYEELIGDLEAAAPRAVAYAGFWARGAALTIDTMIAGMLVAIFGWVGIVLQMLHVTIGHAFFGRTIAKWALSIRVHKRDGGSLGLPRALLRTVVSLWLPIYLGAVIWATQGANHLRNVVEHLQPREAAEAKSFFLAMAISNGLMTLLWIAGLFAAAFHPERRSLHDLVAGSRVTYALRRISLPPAAPAARRDKR